MNSQEIQDKLKEIILPYVTDKTLISGIGAETDLLKDLKINYRKLLY